jgi:hypothetical protein
MEAEAGGERDCHPKGLARTARKAHRGGPEALQAAQLAHQAGDSMTQEAHSPPHLAAPGDHPGALLEAPLVALPVDHPALRVHQAAQQAHLAAPTLHLQAQRALPRLDQRAQSPPAPHLAQRARVVHSPPLQTQREWRTHLHWQSQSA